MIRKAVLRGTLNQSGTKPFHLKATFAPTFERDQGSGRTGIVEIWWESPTKWRRDVQCPIFRQTEIMNGLHEWQKNEGDYFPEWLREVAQALIEPVPSLDEVLQEAKGGEVRTLGGQTETSWQIFSTDGNVKKSIGAGIYIDESGALTFANGFGFSAGLKDYRSFHGRMVARAVNVGTPQVTAEVGTLEDLGQVPADFFDAQAAGSDEQLLETAIVEETDLRKNLVITPPLAWATPKDGPLEGIMTTEVVVDRSGTIREIGSILSDNPVLSDDFHRIVLGMLFSPYSKNGVPVQVLSRITMPFKTVRPTGTETFDSAQNYFERGRLASFLSAGAGAPYILRANFKVRVTDGTVRDGEYVDTWMKSDQWRREASVGKSRFVRSQDGDKRYLLAEGPDAKIMGAVLQILEPIPAIDTFVESDWRIKRDALGELSTIRVLTGYEAPDGTLDQAKVRAFWFDASGRLVKALTGGLEIEPSNFMSFRDAQIARDIKVLRGGNVGMLIHVSDITTASDISGGTFKIPGHEWKRAFTDETR